MQLVYLLTTGICSADIWEPTTTSKRSFTFRLEGLPRYCTSNRQEEENLGSAGI